MGQIGEAHRRHATKTHGPARAAADESGSCDRRRRGVVRRLGFA
jgi:hypothetical protein